MKNLIRFLIFFFLHVLFISSQVNIQNTNSKFSIGNAPCLKIEILEADDDFCKKEWDRTLDGFKNEKIKKSGNEIFADNVLIPEMGNNPVDIYTTIEYQKKSGKTVICSAVDLGGAFLNSGDHSEKFKIYENILKKYANGTQKKFFEKKLEDQTEEQRKIFKKINNLTEDNKELNDKIFKAENDIKKNEKEISETKSKLEIKKKEVESQKKVVAASSNAVKEQQKSSEKILEKLQDEQKDLEKNIKKLENENEDLSDRIKKHKEKIKSNEEEISNLKQKSEQISKDIQITEQEIKKYR